MIKLIPILLQSVAADHCKSYVSISDLVTNEQCQAKCTTSHDCVLLEDTPYDEDIANAEELNYESQSAVILTDTPYDEEIANAEELNYESQSAVILTDTPYDEEIANAEELNYESQSAATPSLRSSNIANSEELNYESQSAVVLTDTPYDEEMANAEVLNYESQSAASPSLRSSTRSTSPYGPWDYELLPLECGFGYVMDVDTNIGTANKLYKMSTDGTYSDILSQELTFEEGLRGGIGFDKATGALFGLANPTSGGHEVFALGYGQDGSTIELRKYNVKTTDGSILSAEAACDVFNPQDGSAGYYTCCTAGSQCGFFRLSDTKGPADHYVWHKFNHTQGALISYVGDINFVPGDTDPTYARFFGVNDGSDVTMCSANFETKELRCWNSGWIFLSEMRLTGFNSASSYINNDLNVVVHDLKGNGLVIPFTDGSLQPAMGYRTFPLRTSMGERDGASCAIRTTATASPTTKEPEDSTTETATEDPTTEVPEDSTTETATEEPTTEVPEDSTTEVATEDPTTEEPEDSTSETSTSETATEEPTTEEPEDSTSETSTSETATEAATTTDEPEDSTTDNTTETPTTTKKPESSTTETATTTKKPESSTTNNATTTEEESNVGVIVGSAFGGVLALAAAIAGSLFAVKKNRDGLDHLELDVEAQEREQEEHVFSN